VRTFSEGNTQLLHQLAPELIHSIARNYGVTATVEFSKATKVLMNDPKAVTVVEKVAQELVGEARYQIMPTPMAGGEDFASIVHKIPGAFVFVGACPPEIDYKTAPTNHSTKAQFDDSVLPLCASLLAGLALEHLG
jgi:hippurate hydrolase